MGRTIENNKNNNINTEKCFWVWLINSFEVTEFIFTPEPISWGLDLKDMEQNLLMGKTGNTKPL